MTDPTAPKYCGRRATPFTSGAKTYVLGRAQGAAIGTINTTAGVKFAYFLLTDNTNGTWGNGYNLYALDANDGSVIWRVNKTYLNDTTHNDVPGVAAIIDAAGDGGPISKVYLADIEGKVWAINAGDGSSPTKIFDAATKYATSTSINYPIESGIALFRDTTAAHDLSIMGVTGGAGLGAVDDVQRGVQARSRTHPRHVNGDADDAGHAGDQRARLCATDDRGNNAYFITSIGNLQSSIGNSFTATGNLMRIDLGTNASSTLAVVKRAPARSPSTPAATSSPRRPRASRRTATAGVTRRRRSRCRT